ncbi:MAG: LysE family transporter [Proteobacteria bacterium]|nr:LysE family transporter [Pseudomonadota bacterium]MDA1291329.1 LysE family transporter [Pseudomonadota bacterium]
MENPFLYLFVGFLVCLLGTIPFGPINLAVVKTTIDYDRRSGIEIAFAASIIESLQALIAICFGALISSFLDANVFVKFFLAFVFIALAIFIFTRKAEPTLKKQQSRPLSFFRNGLIIAGLNPQAVPFWIFALATISQYFEFQYMGLTLAWFLLGVFIGKLVALYGFIVASTYLKTRLQESSTVVNRLLAGILLFIGLIQGWNAVNSLLV